MRIINIRIFLYSKMGNLKEKIKQKGSLENLKKKEGI